MPFQFQCTCGQILAANESQQGQHTQCPKCGTVLAIPYLQPVAPQPFGQAPPPTPAAPFGYPGSAPVPPGFPQQSPFPGQVPQLPNVAAPQSAWPGTQPTAPQFPAPSAPTPAANLPSFPFMGEQQPSSTFPSNQLELDTPNVPGEWQSEPDLSVPQIWHIPCPKGHILETPDEMLDQEVLCPYCETQFVLKHAKSIEAIQKRERELEIRDARRGELWLKWSIGIAVFVVLGLIILMIAFSS